VSATASPVCQWLHGGEGSPGHPDDFMGVGPVPFKTQRGPASPKKVLMTPETMLK